MYYTPSSDGRVNAICSGTWFDALQHDILFRDEGTNFWISFATLC